MKKGGWNPLKMEDNVVILIGAEDKGIIPNPNCLRLEPFDLQPSLSYGMRNIFHRDQQQIINHFISAFSVALW